MDQRQDFSCEAVLTLGAASGAFQERAEGADWEEIVVGRGIARQSRCVFWTQILPPISLASICGICQKWSISDQRSASPRRDGDDKGGAASQKSAIEETGAIRIAKKSDGPEIKIDRGMEMKNWRSLAAVVVGALFSLASAAPLSASEGGAGPEAMTMGNMCMVMFGYDMIHITAYQPGKSRSEYCAEIPSAGPTILVFDIENPAFRDMPLELRIIRDPLTPITKDTDLEALTEVYRPATKYTKGTFNLEHDFKNNGHYIGLVTLTRPDGAKETSEFKFRVGETLWAWVPQIAGTVLIAGIVFVYWKHTHPSSKKKDAAGVAAS